MIIKYCTTFTALILLMISCASTRLITNIDQIEEGESIVIVKVVQMDYDAPSVLVGHKDKINKRKKRIDMPSIPEVIGVYKSFYICEVVTPGTYTLYTSEYEPYAPQDIEFRNFQASSNQPSMLPSSRFVRRDMVTFTVPKDKLVNAGVVTLKSSKHSVESSYERKNWDFSVKIDLKNIIEVKKAYPELFIKFAKKLYVPTLSKD